MCMDMITNLSLSEKRKVIMARLPFPRLAKGSGGGGHSHTHSFLFWEREGVRVTMVRYPLPLPRKGEGWLPLLGMGLVVTMARYLVPFWQRGLVVVAIAICTLYLSGKGAGWW